MGAKVGFKVNKQIIGSQPSVIVGVPHGTIDIDENGKYDVSEYAYANVDVVSKEIVQTIQLDIQATDLVPCINDFQTFYYSGSDAQKINEQIINQVGSIKFELNLTDLNYQLGMWLKPSMWFDSIHDSKNFQGTLIFDGNFSALGAGSRLNEIIVRAVTWVNSDGSYDSQTSIAITIIPIK